MLYETIHIFQGAFVEEKEILDVVLAASEVVIEKRCLGKEGMASRLTLRRLTITFVGIFWTMVWKEKA